MKFNLKKIKMIEKTIMVLVVVLLMNANRRLNAEIINACKLFNISKDFIIIVFYLIYLY
jgi:hypothetical protein